MRLVKKLAFDFVCHGAVNPNEPFPRPQNAPALFALCYSIPIAVCMDPVKRQVLPLLFEREGVQ